MRSTIGLLFFFLCSLIGRTQVGLSPLNPFHTTLVQRHIAQTGEIRQTAFAPYLLPIEKLDSIYDADTKNWKRQEHTSWVMKKMRNEHLIEVSTKDFVLKGDAVFNLEAARQTDDQGRRRFTNSRGYNFTGAIGERFFFATSFCENQSIFPNYMDSVVSARGDFNDPADPERGSVPGFGRWKPFNTSKSYDYDYTLGTGYIGVALSEQSFVQFGHDKQFIGYGHRSLLLSDASAPYTFLRLHGSFFKNKLTYTTTWAVLQYLERVASVNYNNKEAMFRRLGARFSYLHFQPKHWVGIGLFDGSTWDWRRNSHPSSIEYYSPHAFLYTENGIRNHILGLNAHLDPLKFASLYGQLALNTRSGGDAYQIGLKLNPFSGLQIQVEYNDINSAFYYSSKNPNLNSIIVTEPFQAGTLTQDYYQHNDQSLGHPIGTAVQELLLRVNYRFRDLFVSGAYHSMKKGQPLFLATVDYFQFEGGYIINPKSNASIAIGNINRTERNGVKAMLDTYTYIAFRTSLLNRYLDF